jgi:hypothetical protein
MCLPSEKWDLTNKNGGYFRRFKHWHLWLFTQFMLAMFTSRSSCRKSVETPKKVPILVIHLNHPSRKSEHKRSHRRHTSLAIEGDIYIYIYIFIFIYLCIYTYLSYPILSYPIYHTYIYKPSFLVRSANEIPKKNRHSSHWWSSIPLISPFSQKNSVWYPMIGPNIRPMWSPLHLRFVSSNPHVWC